MLGCYILFNLHKCMNFIEIHMIYAKKHKIMYNLHPEMNKAYLFMLLIKNTKSWNAENLSNQLGY